MQRSTRIKKGIAIWNGCNYDQIMNDVKEIRKILRLNPPQRHKPEKCKFIPYQHIRLLLNCISKTFKNQHTQNIVQMLIELQLDTNMRLSEALNLRIDQIDMENRFIPLKITKGNKPRTLVFSERMKEILQTYLRGLHSSQIYIFERYINGIPRGKYTPRTIQVHIKKLRENVKKIHGIDIDFVTSHTFRHDYATKFAAAGMNPALLAALMGHEDSKTTERVYIQKNPLILKQVYDEADHKIQIGRIQNTQ